MILQTSQTNPQSEATGNKAWFLKPTYGKPNIALMNPKEREKLYASMALFSISAKSFAGTFQNYEESKIKKKQFANVNTGLRLRYKRGPNACQEHKRKHQRCPSDCTTRKAEGVLKIKNCHNKIAAALGNNEVVLMTPSKPQMTPSKLQTHPHNFTPMESPTSIPQQTFSGLVYKFLMYENQMKVLPITTPNEC